MDFSKLVQLMARLREEGGCPWDRKQTIETLKPYLIEETYELVDAIESKEPGQIREELGDLLFQVVFLTRICQDNGWFDITEVIEQIHQKMVRRHPHVFGESSAETPEQVLDNWNKIKAIEKAKQGKTSVTDDIPQKLPALRKAFRLQRKVAMVGFEWSKIEDVLAKVDEELGELRQGIREENHDSIEEELGDLLFSIVNTARFLNIDAENSLNKTITKFIDRFKKVENNLTAAGKRIDQFTLEEMDAEWEKIKKERG
jgi:nucleoside triphosphate diphosphatase